MPAAVAQDVSGTIGMAASQTLSFASPVTAGSLLVLLFFTVDNGVAGIQQVKFNGATAPAPFADTTNSMVTQQIWSAVGGEQYVQVIPVNPPSTEWAASILEITGEAHIPPYPLNNSSGPSGAPTTLNMWDADDNGVTVGTVAIVGTETIAAPVGWTLIATWAGSTMSAAVAWRAVTVGLQASETWVVT